MATAKHFETANNKAHAEQWESFLNNFYTPVKDCQFFFKGNCLAVVVEDAPKDVTVLDNGHHFLHESSGHRVKDTLKELLVVVKLKCELKLELESLPHMVIFAHFWPWIAKHLVLQKVVKFLGIFPVLTKCVHLDETFLSAAISRDMEFVGSLRVVNLVLVCQLKELVHSSASCQMSVMHCWFRHHIKAFIEI